MDTAYGGPDKQQEKRRGKALMNKVAHCTAEQRLTRFKHAIGNHKRNSRHHRRKQEPRTGNKRYPIFIGHSIPARRNVAQDDDLTANQRGNHNKCQENQSGCDLGQLVGHLSFKFQIGVAGLHHTWQLDNFTPRFEPDNRINWHIHPTKNALGKTFTCQSGQLIG